MLELYQTPVDILYLVLSVSVGLLVIFLIVALYHVIKILSNVRTVSEKAKDTVDLVNHYLWVPIKVIMKMFKATRGKK